MTANPATPDTRETLIDLAMSLVTLVGYNAFSFRDLAAAAGITTASVHYHFPTKADLGLALVARQRAMEAAALRAIDAAGGDAVARLRGFAGAFRAVLDDGHRMCLCGMLAAEHQTLPEPLTKAVRDFFAGTEGWIAGVLRAGRRSGELAFPGTAAAAARALVASLEGATLVAKAFGDPARFDQTLAWHLARLRA